ncbi:MAG: hypothetical protein AAFY02_13880 [Pseudomonadota bacterium]
MAVELRPAQPGDARLLADSLRAADRAEVLASDGLDPLAALQRSLALSSEAYLGLVNGQPAALLGVRRISLSSDHGIPWLLTGVAVEQAPLSFLRASRSVVAVWRRDYASLSNWVDARHETAKRWLAWLGFTLGPARPYGVAGLPFHPFHLEGPLMSSVTRPSPPDREQG